MGHLSTGKRNMYKAARIAAPTNKGQSDSESVASQCSSPEQTQGVQKTLNPSAPAFFPSYMERPDVPLEPAGDDVTDVDMASAASDETAADDSEPCRIEATTATEQFIDGLGAALTRWCEQYEASGATKKAGRFHSAHAPPMTISAYLKRLRKYFLCPDECFVIALAFIDRATNADPAIPVCELTVHRLLLTAVVLAVKMHDDLYYSNSYYAKVGGLTLREVNVLESIMVKALNWQMHVTASEYKLYHDLISTTA